MVKVLIVVKYLNQILQQLKILEKSMQRAVPNLLQRRMINTMTKKRIKRLRKNSKSKPTKHLKA